MGQEPLIRLGTSGLIAGDLLDRKYKLNRHGRNVCLCGDLADTQSMVPQLADTLRSDHRSGTPEDLAFPPGAPQPSLDTHSAVDRDIDAVST
jgi:hypothetical protein